MGLFGLQGFGPRVWSFRAEVLQAEVKRLFHEVVS